MYRCAFSTSKRVNVSPGSVAQSVVKVSLLAKSHSKNVVVVIMAYLLP